MDLKILFMLLVYYSLISLFFLSAGSEILEGYNTTVELNTSEMQSGELDTGGLFGTGISFGRFAGMIAFGVGLPNDTPTWFNTMFIIWQSMLLVFTVGFVISSIWNG